MCKIDVEVQKSVKAQFDLTDRVCVVTGGAGFLGAQFAESLAEMGAHPVLWDLVPEAAGKVCERIRQQWGKCEWRRVDVTDLDAIRLAVKDVLETHGHIDVLINNAALTKYGCDADPDSFFAPFEETNPAVWQAGLTVNLTGVALCCQVIGPAMVKRRKGSIINIGSDVGVISPDQRIYQSDEKSGYTGMNFNIPAFYSVSKGGVIQLTKYLATLWAPNNVRVNAFSPAGVYRNHDPSFVQRLTERIPMGRMGMENEYKGAIVFLASDASSYMTGHNLIMDGGRTVW
ncbi:SDR family oxidoreductase [Nitrospiraceae bacterium AH_259_D15_M11_P09]|nr:SDR family oxidoreductase [Nitrospiraceae bacterium AH_259_D15_M11_P09]